LEKAMHDAVAEYPDVKVLVRSAKEAKHVYLANVLSICKHAGVVQTHIMVKTLE